MSDETKGVLVILSSISIIMTTVWIGVITEQYLRNKARAPIYEACATGNHDACLLVAGYK